MWHGHRLEVTWAPLGYDRAVGGLAVTGGYIHLRFLEMLTLIPQNQTKIPQETTSDRLLWFPGGVISYGMLSVPLPP